VEWHRPERRNGRRRDRRPGIGHLLHIRVIVALVSGNAVSSSILINAPDGIHGDSFATLPANKTAKTWNFGSLTASPNAVVTPSASSVPANSTGNTASVPVTPGATYAWTISGGSITAGQGASQITWSANSTGPVTLGVTVAKGCSSTGSAIVQVTAANNQAPPMVGISRNADRTVTLTIQGTAGVQYLFQAATDLGSPVWTTISTSVAGPDGLVSFMDADSAIYPVRFYRAVAP